MDKNLDGHRVFGLANADKARMAHASVVLLGRLSIERRVVDCLESEFGFSFKEVESLQDSSDWNRAEVVAVLFNPNSVGAAWQETLSAILLAFPRALPILCHGFAEQIDWPEAADAGAYHSIPMPIKLTELRQSLGFVWGARRELQGVGSLAAAG
ncbi:MAG TPA: hypothetical protein VFW44_18980 [Bryobacteraceae bacterium]|nr:hypothetical protein [Bryobacteraceae bacterium]